MLVETFAKVSSDAGHALDLRVGIGLYSFDTDVALIQLAATDLPEFYGDSTGPGSGAVHSLQDLSSCA